MQLSPEAEEILIGWVSCDYLDDEPWFDFINQFISDNGTNFFDERALLYLIKRYSDAAGKPIDLDDETVFLSIQRFPRMMSCIINFMRRTGRS